VNDEELKAYLCAKATIAGDLYRDGKITRAECFRHEVDLATGRNSGPIKLIDGTTVVKSLSLVQADFAEIEARVMADSKVGQWDATDICGNCLRPWQASPGEGCPWPRSHLG